MFRWPVILLPLVMLAGCSVVDDVRDERYERNNSAGDRWLSDQFGAAEMDVSGKWLSSDWGHGELQQNGRNVTGTLGGYNIKGVVSGTKAYLLIADGDWYYYSAVLEKPREGLLTGRFSRAIPYMKNLSRSMRLEQLAY